MRENGDFSGDILF